MGESGRNIYIFTAAFNPFLMNTYTGEFECTLDAKGRLLIPAALLRQLPAFLRKNFIVNRSVFARCLVLFPMDAWNEITADLGKLNRFSKKNDDFIRQFHNGAVQVDMDGNTRILLPKRLLDYAGVKKDVVLFASLNRVEIWSAKEYNRLTASYNPKKFAALAEEVMSQVHKSAGQP